MKVTPETLTDAQIIKYGRSCRDGTISDAIARNQCVVALGLASPSLPAARTMAARERICDAINARAGAKQ